MILSSNLQRVVLGVCRERFVRRGYETELAIKECIKHTVDPNPLSPGILLDHHRSARKRTHSWFREATIKAIIFAPSPINASLSATGLDLPEIRIGSRNR